VTAGGKLNGIYGREWPLSTQNRTLESEVYRWHFVGVHTRLFQPANSALAPVRLVICDRPVAPVPLSFRNQDIIRDAGAVQRQMAIAWTVRFYEADARLLSFAARNQRWENAQS
jgi:hypothetical protein